MQQIGTIHYFRQWHEMFHNTDIKMCLKQKHMKEWMQPALIKIWINISSFASLISSLNKYSSWILNPNSTPAHHVIDHVTASSCTDSQWRTALPGCSVWSGWLCWNLLMPVHIKYSSSFRRPWIIKVFLALRPHSCPVAEQTAVWN